MNIKYIALFSVLAVCSNSSMAPRLRFSGFHPEEDSDFQRGFLTGTFDQLVEAISTKEEPEFRRLLPNLFDINYRSGYLQRTLAHVCAATKALHFLRIIHDYEPDYSLRDREGYTPLMIALEVGYPEEVDFLLPHSDLTIKNNLDQTVFELARSVLIMRGEDAETRAAWQLLQDFKIHQLEQELAASVAREATVRAAFFEVSTRKTESKKRKRLKDVAVCYVCCADKQENGTLLKVTDHPCGGSKHAELLCRACFDRLHLERKPCPLCNEALKKAGAVSWRTLKPDASGPVHKKLKIVLKTCDSSSSDSSSSSSDSDSQ